MYYQTEITLQPRSRGYHLITREVENAIAEISKIKTGLAHIFIKHTSASLTINENVSPDVRIDLNNFFDRMVPDNAPYFEHTLEGPDDMSAHIKSSILGYSLTIPITNGRLNLGTWQGIYLNEHRNHASSREVIATIIGV